MVDLLILEKRQVLSKDAKRYIPLEQRANNIEGKGSQEQYGENNQVDTKSNSIIKESLELLREFEDIKGTDKLDGNMTEIHMKTKEVIDSRMKDIITAIIEGVEVDEIVKSDLLKKETDKKIKDKAKSYDIQIKKTENKEIVKPRQQVQWKALQIPNVAKYHFGAIQFTETEISRKIQSEMLTENNIGFASMYLRGDI